MSLVVRWLCDETTTTTLSDSSGNSNDGTLTTDASNLTTTGPGNNLTAALDLGNVAGSYGQIATTVSYPFAIMGWFEFATTPNFRNMLGVLHSSTAGRKCGLEPGYTVERVLAVKRGLSARDTYGNNPMPDGWRHYTVVFNSSSSATLYLDSVALLPTETGITEDPLSSLDILRVGDSFGCDIKVADIRLYSSDPGLDAIKAAYAEAFVGTATTISSHTAAQNIEHPSGDSGTVLTIAASGDDFLSEYALEGTDAAQFTVNPSTGVVAFAATPDYANPTDANTDNVYAITLVARARAGDAKVAVTVTVTSVGPPVNTVAPVISKVS